MDNGKLPSLDPIKEEVSEETDRVRKKPRDQEKDRQKKEKENIHFMENEEKQYRLSSEDLSKYQSYTSIRDFLKNDKLHVGRENCAVIRYLSNADFPSLDVIIAPWKPYVIFKIWREFTTNSHSFLCIKDFDFFPKGTFPSSCGPLTEIIHSTSPNRVRSIIVPKMKNGDDTKTDDVKKSHIPNSYFDAKQSNQIYLDDVELLKRIQSNENLEDFESTFEKDDGPFDFSTGRDKTPSKDAKFTFTTLDLIETDDTDNKEEEEEEDEDDVVNLRTPKKTTDKSQLNPDELRYPLNMDRDDIDVGRYQRQLARRTLYHRTTVDRVMRSMIGRCMDKLFMTLTDGTKTSICIDDDSPVLANLLTQYTHNRKFWIKLMTENKLAVRLNHTEKDKRGVLYSYFDSSIQYTGVKVLRKTVYEDTFTKVWGSVKWFNLAQFENDAEGIIYRHMLFRQEMTTNPEYKTKIDWYVNHRMKLYNDAPKDPKKFEEWRNNFINLRLTKVNKDDAYSFVRGELFFSTGHAMDWSMMKISMDGFSVYVYEVLPDNSCIFLRLTTMDTVYGRSTDTLKNVIIIDYFEHRKLAVGVKKSSDVLKSTSSVFIKRLADACKRAWYTLLVNTIAETVEAVSFWDKMRKEKHVELSRDATNTITVFKKDVIEKYVTNYFYELLEKETLGDLRRDWRTLIPKAIKKELIGANFIGDRIVGPCIEASCILPYSDTITGEGKMNPRVKLHRNDIVILLKK